MKLFGHKNGKGGFTLAEMLMVIGILAILLAFAVPGVASYSKRIKLMELDDSARSIFMAAQNRLMALKSAGVTNLTFDKATEIPLEEIYEKFLPDKDDETGKKDIEDIEDNIDFRYITSEDVKEIEAGKPNIIGVSDGGGAVNTSSIESQLYQNDFIIEYDARSGFVFGVFYSETAGALDFDNFNSKGIKRDFEDRLANGGNIGYYGGGALVEIPDGIEQVKPIAGSSSKEKLAVSIDFPKDYPEDKVYFTVSITGYDYRAYTDPANKEKYKHTIAIISKDDRCYIERDKNCTIILDSIAPGKSADTYAPPYRDESKDYYGWWLPDQTRYKAVDGYNLSDWVMERDFKGWVYAGYFARKDWDTDGLDKNNGKLEDFYLLDSEGYFKHYVEHSTDYRYDSTDYRYGGDVKEWNRWGYVYPVGCGGYEAGKEAINDGGHVTSQNPFVYYIIDPGSDITVEYSFYDASKAPDKDIHGDPLVFNSYFDKLENGIAYVSAGRHLQNLAFYTYYGLIKEVYITKTIDFSEDHTGLEDAYDYWNSAETNKGTERATNLYDFVPIDNKFVNPTTAPNILPDPNADSEIMIKYIRIDSTTYGKTDPNIVQTFTESNHDTTGFFTTTKNRSMAGLVFYCPVVIGGGQYTGAVLGKPYDAGVQLKNVTVINPIVEGPGYVGGICGEWPSPEFSNNKVLVEEVEDYFDNYNGGESLWRNARKKDLEEGKCEDITWGDPSNDPYQKFYIKGKTEASYAGGLIGCARDQVSKSSASVRVEGEGYAGGLIGLSSGITFSNNYVGGHTYNGQFAGVIEDGTPDGKPYVLVNVYGKKGAGGLIGKVDDGRITLNGAYSTCSVASEDSEKADVMVGEGQYEPQSPSYAAGWVVDKDGKKITKTPRYGGELKPVKAEASNQVYCEPYDEYISLFYEKYPYFAQSSVHIGDWPIDPPIFGVFYWEKVGGDYKIKSIYYDVKEDEDENYTTLDASLTSPSGEYGYGYFYTSTVESANKNMLDGIGESKTTEAKIKEDLENRLSVDLTVVMRKTSGSNDAHGLRTLSFVYDYAGRNGIKNFYFNPDFCGVSFNADLGAPKTEGEEAYHIRNVKQFNNITNSLGSSFVQDADLTVSAHNPIGDLSAYFTGKYNGSNKKITVSSVKTEELTGIGLFGVTRNAQIMNINLDYNGGAVSVSNKADRTGVGGVVGIAIGGSISDCKVTGFSVAANENDEIAIGGIAGYSSASITNCNFGTLDAGSERFVVTSLSPKVNAVGGIAGSASGKIENCNTNSMKTALSAGEGLVLAGGIVGNNVDYVNGIHLEVTGCKSYASLTRPEVKTAVNTTYKSNVLIHPIAPTVLTVKTGDSELYSSLAWLDPTSPEWKQKLSELLSVLGIPFSMGDENAPEYRIITGTGCIENSEAPDVKISKCTAKVGAAYYNSLIYGDISVDKETSSPTNDPSDVYVAVPPEDAYYQTYVKVPPTVGIYSLYEHANGTLRAKPYLDYKESVKDEPENNLYDPIDEYGILVSFGRIDDEKLNITVTLPSGASQKVNVPGTSYVGLDGNAISITDAYKRAYFDFSEATFKEPGRYTVTAEYEGTTTVYTFEIKTRAPYVGVYGVLDGETKDKIAGVYTDRKRVGEEALVMPFDPETNAFVGKYGIMLEHSINRPKTLNNGISVVLQVKDGATISLSDSDFTLIGTGIYKTSEDKTPTSYGKTFDYYELNKKAFANVPEGSTFSLTVTSDTDAAKVLATYEFKKEVRVPHLAVVAVKKEGSEARAVIKNPDSEAPVTVPENIGQDPVDILHFGILLEDGFNKENLKVELLGEDNSLLRTLEGTNIGNAAEYKLEGVNGTTGRINGVKYLRLSLPDKSMEKVHVIKLTYTDAVGNPHELSVSVANDLKGNIREHQHSYDNNWEYIDDDKHGRYCVDDNCDNKDMSLQAQDHDIKYVVTQKPVGNQKGIRHKYCKICKHSWEDEEFEAVPYLGIYALYYKYELDENGKPKRDGDGYKLDESKKYAAAVIMSDVKEQFLIPDGTYGELTGEYGFLIDSAYDFYNGDKIRLRVGNIGGDRPIADRYRSDGPYEIIDGSGKTFADYNGRTINYYKINVGEINGDVSVGIKVWDEKANDYKSVIDIPKSTFENRPYNGCQHHSDSWEQTEEMHIGECDKCKEHVEEPHIFGEVREVTPAKPEQNGLIEHICSICEYALPEVVEYNSKPDINIIAVYDYKNKSDEHKIIGRAFINGKEVGYKPNDAWYDLNPSYYGLLIGKGVEFEKIEVILPDFGNEHYVHKIGISKADINSLSNAGDFIDYNLIRINYFDTSVEVHITYDGKEIYKGHIGDPFK